MLIEHLPAESATVRAASGRPRQDWTIGEHLLAGVHEQIQFNTHVLGAVNAGKGKNPVSKPTRLPRPELSEREQAGQAPRRQSSASEIRKFFSGPGTGMA